MSRDGWKETPAGRVLRFVGGVKFAVPLLAVVTVAMIWGTWVDSTQGREQAMGEVYGSWWFIALMALVCASLIFSVATRYPWKRRHFGFIVVHASLIALIIVGFYTMFTKIEGRIILQEGGAAREMQMQAEQIQLLAQHDHGLHAMEAARLNGQRQLAFGDARLEIVGTWVNTTRVMEVTNDRGEPLHAAEVTLQPGATAGVWVEEGSPQAIGNLTVRVLPQGETWSAPTSKPEAVLVLEAEEGSAPILPAPGVTLGETGWTVSEVEHYERATISGGAITERPDGPLNRAIKVVLTHEDGSSERLIAFERFRGAPFKTLTAGQTPSPFSLTYQGDALDGPTLAIMRRDDGAVHAIFSQPGAEPIAFEHEGGWPWTVQAGTTPVTILRNYEQAKGVERVVEAPAAENTRPAVLVRPAGTEAEPTPLVWRQPTPVQTAAGTLVLEYGPVMVPLPFEIQLLDFRRSDYPGSNMAMAYESDVRVTLPESQPFEFNIHMNHPYQHGGWKVYQSGYQGETVSIFQVTRDPGLAWMYLASTTLTLGIIITFYSRSLSWGHPDIPSPFQSHSH